MLTESTRRISAITIAAALWIAILGVLVFAMSAHEPAPELGPLTEDEMRELEDARFFYIATILQAVNANYRRPKDPDMARGLRAAVALTKRPDGEIIEMEVQRSSGNATVDVAAVNAVWRSSPLPVPDDPDLFNPRVVISFDPDG